MDKGTVVFIPCIFKSGGFPNERVFIIRPGDVEFRGIADAQYCYDPDGNSLGNQPLENNEIKGCVLGLVVGVTKASILRVYLPDGEVYELDRANIKLARDVKESHVLV